MPTADTVTVVLAAQTDAYLADIRQAGSEFHAMTAKMEADAIAAGRQFSVIGTNANTALGSTLPSAAGKAGQAIKGTSLQTANMAAQFQDVAVQLQAGQSPFLIALQQGTQLSAVLQQTANPVRALGAAFLSVINPVSLATIGIIALGGVAIQYFASILGDGKASSEVIKEQDGLIRDVADRWGEAVPALRSYIDQLDRAADIQQAQEGGELAAVRQYEKLRDLLPDITAQMADVVLQLQTAGAETGEIVNLQNAFNNLSAEVQAGTADVEDNKAVTDALAALIQSVGLPALQDLLTVFANLSPTIAEASRQAGIFREEAAALGSLPGMIGDIFAGGRERFQGYKDFISEQLRVNTLTEDQLDLETEIARVKSEAGQDNVILTEQQALTIAQGRLDAEKRRAEVRKAELEATRGGTKSLNEAERERQAVLDLISALEFEHSIIGMSAEDQKVMQALRKAGAAATDEQKLRIEELVRATTAETEALRANKEAMEQIKSIASDVLKGFISDLRQGKSAAEALGNVFDKLAEKLIDMAVNNLVGAAFGGLTGGGGGGIGSFFSSLFGGGARAAPMPRFLSGRAGGGPVTAGMPYKVGENGTETFVPSANGYIAPHKDTGAGGGLAVVRLELSEDIDARIVNVSGPVAVQVMRSGIQQYDRGSRERAAEKELRYG